jgi:AcrR family transcriptional regulator
MVKNPSRRNLLADAGLRVLASSGARGLTHRAVDAEAGVPTGTTSNYFRSRDALLGALGERIMERFAPDPAIVSRLAGRPYVEYLRYILERTTAQPELTRALIELRLEAARRPGLAAGLGAVLRAGYRDDVAFHATTDLPGGAVEIALLHYAMDGLLLDMLTTSIGADLTPDEALTAFVERLVPENAQGGAGTTDTSRRRLSPLP